MLALPFDLSIKAMYTQFFKLTHSPFSIAPDPRFLFMSDRHREALAHLLYGVSGGGGFVLLTGEIGAGKTTVCRCFLEQIPENCNVGYIFNPKLTVNELLQSICDEFRIDTRATGYDQASIKRYVDALNAFLLEAHANGRHNVLIIDEAQSLSPEVLEQLRLLTNLETNERKLLQIILIGQPELRTVLEQPQLRQLAQRVIARYHLDALSLAETNRYVQHRLTVAGITSNSPLPAALMKAIHALTQGVPRRINLLCDRALLGAYAEGKSAVNRKILNQAAQEVFGSQQQAGSLTHRRRYATLAVVGIAALAGAAAMAIINQPHAPGKPSVAMAPAKAPTPRPIAVPVRVGSAPTYPTFDVDQPYEEAADAANTSFRQLATLWGQTVADGEPCRVLQQGNLHCYVGKEGMAEIRQLDRPVILSLHDPANRPYSALLIGMTDTQARVVIGDKTYTVSLFALARHFQGDFITLWTTPVGYRDKIHRGDQGPDIDWIATQLAKLNGTPAPAANQIVDQAMTKQIQAFQSSQGLKADGLIGPRTLMQLNRVTDSKEPRLHGTDTGMPASTPTAAAESPRK
ncbi:MAG TPA: AAA family ATPase [Burkholderiaceae bacterium]|jgi:general secretion pathway protein A|nr:AAA family ATPase [Burkholderiaceae bacterium]